MKGSTNGMNAVKGVMEYTELEPTKENMNTIGLNQQAMLILDNAKDSRGNTYNISGIVYFVGPMVYYTTSTFTTIWGAINNQDYRMSTTLAYAYIDSGSGTLMIFSRSYNGSTSSIYITSAELLAHARLYVADLPGGGGQLSS